MPKPLKVIYKNLKQYDKPDHEVRGLHNEGIIHVDTRGNNRVQLGSLIHEALHERFPDWSETKVLEVERFLAGVIWRDFIKRKYVPAGKEKPATAKGRKA